MLYRISASPKTVKWDFHCFLNNNENVNDRNDGLYVYTKNVAKKSDESKEKCTNIYGKWYVVLHTNISV